VICRCHLLLCLPSIAHLCNFFYHWA
jgi:hypothetical protein